jgi:hypothetical protein
MTHKFLFEMMWIVDLGCSFEFKNGFGKYESAVPQNP